MRGVWLSLALAAALLFCPGGVLWAQSEEAPETSPGEPTVSPRALPEPYEPEKESSFLSGLRRFEIVAFGSFPIMLFYSNFGYDLSRYIRSGYDSYYAPWPFKSEYSYQASDSEVLRSIGTAALLSLGVGTIDAILRAVRSHKAREPVRVDSR